MIHIMIPVRIIIFPGADFTWLPLSVLLPWLVGSDRTRETNFNAKADSFTLQVVRSDPYFVTVFFCLIFPLVLIRRWLSLLIGYDFSVLDSFMAPPGWRMGTLSNSIYRVGCCC